MTRPLPSDEGHALVPADRLVVAVHGVLRVGRGVLETLESDGAGIDDAMSLAVTRSTALGLASFRLRPLDRPAEQVVLHEGTERWSQHMVTGDWTQDGRVRELLAVRVDLDRRGGREHQRLPVLPLVALAEDVLTRLGRVTLTGVHAELPLAVASDAMRDVAVASHWFELGAGQRARRVDAIVRLWTDADGPEVERALDAEVARFTAVRERALPAVTRVAARVTQLVEWSSFDGEPGLSVLEPPAEPGAPLVVAYRCRAVEWSWDLAAWTLEWMGELVRRSVPTTRLQVRLAARRPGGRAGA